MLDVQKLKEFSKYDRVTIFLKNTPTAIITLSGKIVSVDVDNYTCCIETENSQAAFDLTDVVSIVTGTHTATKA